MYSYGVAKTEPEKAEVLSLIKRIYAAQGYDSGNEVESSFKKYLFSSQTKIFIARVNGVLFATVAVVLDSAQDLPMDVLYKEDLAKIRNRGKIAEVIQFAVDHKLLEKNGGSTTSPNERFTASFPLLSLVFHYAQFMQLNYLCITINPKHQSFYHSLGFEEIGELKFYPYVNNAPALANVLDLNLLSKKDLPGILSSLLQQKPEDDLFL